MILSFLTFFLYISLHFNAIYVENGYLTIKEWISRGDFSCPRQIFYYICYCICWSQNSAHAQTLYCLLWYIHVLPVVWKSSKQQSKTLLSIKQLILLSSTISSSHAVRDLGRVRQYPPWLLFAAFVDSVGYPRYNPQKTRKQWRTRDFIDCEGDFPI